VRLRLVLLVLLVAAVTAAPAGAGVFVVKGRGWGHGIGMSQYGAQGLALQGWSYRRILAHYYRGTTLARVPDRIVRVLVASGRSRVAVASRRPFRLRDAGGRSWTLRPRRFVVTPGPRIRIRGRRIALRLPLVVEPGASPLTLDGAAYRGALTIARDGSGLSVVNRVRLDFYVRGVVAWEMPESWQPHALAAQAVAARSYALSLLGAREAFDVYADTRDQMYGGIRAERTAANRAVTRTSREVLLWRGSVARAYYSSTSGGRTQAVSGVPYLVSVPDPYDSISPRHTWGPYRYSSRRLGARLGVPPPQSVRVVPNSSGRAETVHVRWPGGGTSLSGDEFQRRLRLLSRWFSVRPASAPRAVGRKEKPKPQIRRERRPPRLRGWIVVLDTAPVSAGPAGVRATARRAGARVLRSSDYPGLRPGFYVAAAGPYRSAAAAQGASRRFARRFPGAYPRRL
jgi:stage II sporulation protein D